MDQYCPHCDAVLFRIRALEDGVFGKHKDDPRICQNNDGGYYAICPACRKTVAMEAVSVPVGVGFIVSR